MSINTMPIMPGKIRRDLLVLAAANTNRDGSGTIPTAFTADAVNGSIVERLLLRNVGAIGTACSANVIRAWILFGGNYRLIEEFIMPAKTPSASAAGAAGYRVGATDPQLIGGDAHIIVNWRLAPLEALAFSQHAWVDARDTTHIQCEGGDFSVS